MTHSLADIEKFWACVDRRGPDECWPAIKYVGNTGYGLLPLGPGVMVSMHRFSYELHNGPIPLGLVVDHVCHSRR